MYFKLTMPPKIIACIPILIAWGTNLPNFLYLLFQK